MHIQCRKIKQVLIIILILYLIFAFSGCFGSEDSDGKNDFDLEFTFKTVEDQPHPDWVLEALEDGPVFIEFTQDDINCPPCARMRPKIHELEQEYSDTVVFFIININHNENTMYYKNYKEINTISNSNKTKVYNTYDVENVGKGRPATPTYILITLERDSDWKIKPYFAVGYGEFNEEDAQKTKEELVNILDFMITKYKMN